MLFIALEWGRIEDMVRAGETGVSMASIMYMTQKVSHSDSYI